MYAYTAVYTHNYAYSYMHTFLSMNLETICRSSSQGRYPGREEGAVESEPVSSSLLPVLAVLPLALTVTGSELMFSSFTEQQKINVTDR